MRVEVDVDSAEELAVALRKAVDVLDELERELGALPPAEARLRDSLVAALNEWDRGK